MVADVRPALKVADEVWVATALLHEEHPDRADFEVSEIKAKALAQRRVVDAEYRDISSVYVHALQHAVANLPVNGGAYRLLFATNKSRRRLYRPGDPCDPRRQGSKALPVRDDLPREYIPLLDWYDSVYLKGSAAAPQQDPILALRGLGKDLWAGEDADSYVRRLREGWG